MQVAQVSDYRANVDVASIMFTPTSVTMLRGSFKGLILIYPVSCATGLSSPGPFSIANLLNHQLEQKTQHDIMMALYLLCISKQRTLYRERHDCSLSKITQNYCAQHVHDAKLTTWRCRHIRLAWKTALMPYQTILFSNGITILPNAECQHAKEPATSQARYPCMLQTGPLQNHKRVLIRQIPTSVSIFESR